MRAADLVGGLALCLVAGCGGGGSSGGGAPPAPAPAALAITALAPLAGPDTGGTTVTLTGTGFKATSTITVGGTAATGVTFVSSTRLTATTPAGTAGPADVVVTNPGPVTATATNGFTYTSGAAPAILTLAPTAGATGGGTLITLTGTGFQASATVTVGGVAATNVTITTAGTLTFRTPAGTAGSATVVVTNPDLQAATATNGFVYGTAIPAVTGVVPASGPVAGGTLLTVTGTGFERTATAQPTVRVATVFCTGVQVQTATSLTCTTAAAGVVGPQTVTVVNPNLQNGALAGAFTYLGAAPAVTAITPAVGPTAGGTAVTITGGTFYPGATVTIGGAAATVTSVGGTVILATTPAGTVGPATIVVGHLDGTSGSLTNGFTFQAPAPTLTGVTPAVGPNTGSTTLTLTGTGFLAGATVTVGGVAATSVTVVSGTSLTCVTPSVAPAIGPQNVVVTNIDLQSVTGTGVFNAQGPAPTVTSATPNNGPQTGGTAVTLAGTNYVAGATVTFGGALATGVTVVSATRIDCTTPAGPVGATNVTVTNIDAMAGTGTGAYTWNVVIDTTPPTFGGCASASAISGHAIELRWVAATDNVTAQAQLVYDIYLASTSGGQSYTNPPQFTTDPGVTRFVAGGRDLFTTTYVVVRARDLAGNQDGNTTQRTVALPAVSPGSWLVLTGLGTARYSHTLVALPDGRVLAAGGVGGTGPLATAECFDPRHGPWTANRTPPPQLEGRNGSPSPVRNRLLSGDQGQILRGAVHHLGVLGSFPHPDVHHNLPEPGDRHPVGIAKLLLQRRGNFFLVSL